MTIRLASHPWARRLFIAVCLVIIAAQAAVVAHRRQTHLGDYDVSREMGRRFLAGEQLYAGGLHYPYTPTAAMSFAPLALVRPGVGLALRYAAAVAGLWLTLRLLRIMVERGRRLDSATVLAVEVITVVLGVQYVIRDLDDGGPHLLLLTILVGGMYCVSRGRDALGATWFGLATVLKAPAGLLLPFFLWKRKWKLAGMALAATILWTVLPMAWMGYASWWSHQEEWTRTAVRSVLGNPTPGVKASEQRVQNQALKLAVTRYLVTYPRGHPLSLSHPAYVSFLDLDPDVARWLATAIAMCLLLACAWLTRKRYGGRDDPAWLLEGSAVLILALLLSPVTWAQHIVFIIPALYLIVTEGCAMRRLGVPASAAMGAYIVPALFLNREIVGRDLNVLFLSYGMHTLALLLVLAVILLRRPTAE
jgi:alpha-1,2-mannosyltransferase